MMRQFLAWVTSDGSSGSGGSDPVSIVVYTLAGVILVGTAIAVGVILWRGRKNRDRIDPADQAEKTENAEPDETAQREEKIEPCEKEFPSDDNRQS